MSKNIRIDNLTPAVRKLRSKFEKAQFTEGFQQFADFYEFETQVCNPRSGNENRKYLEKVSQL